MSGPVTRAMRLWPAIGVALCWVAALLVWDTLSGVVLNGITFAASNPLGRTNIIVPVTQAGGLVGFGAVLAVGAARLRGAPRLLGAMAWLNLVACLVFLALGAVLTIDASTLVRLLPLEQRGRFVLVTAKGDWNLVAGAAVFLATGLTARAWSRELRARTAMAAWSA